MHQSKLNWLSLNWLSQFLPKPGVISQRRQSWSRALLIFWSSGFATQMFAAPVVSGNTISWPDDGWYQVQDAVSFDEVCTGGLSCEVTNGTYIVINHSSGSRWNSVEVNSSLAHPVSSEMSGPSEAVVPPNTVAVDGATIRWSDDGWYQVQSRRDYETVCEGGVSCQVEPGDYIVINHTSGQRFENIHVPVSASETTLPGLGGPLGDAAFNTKFSSWLIDHNTIRFQSTGWFQVQKKDRSYEFPTVCEGVMACRVEDGFYQIINHSTGESWQDVRIGGDAVSWSQNIWWETELFTARVSWDMPLYNFEPMYNQFHVYLNGELAATTTGREVLLDDFSRGTNYRVAVYGVDSDGTERQIGQRDVLTVGPSAELTAYGKPAGDRDTFGFEFWNDIPDHQLLDFPSDCLFAIPGGGYCYSPSTRYLLGYTTYSDSEETHAIDWEFPLPGDNTTNHIEALVHFFGSGGRRSPAKEMALVADVTTDFGQSRYEISIFVGNGTFVGTYPILENIQYSSSAGMQRQINLDGSDLSVTLGPLRPYDSFSWVASQPRRLHIVGEYYEPNGTASESDLTGWTRAGAFLAVVDPQTGATISNAFYPGLTIAEVPQP